MKKKYKTPKKILTYQRKYYREHPEYRLSKNKKLASTIIEMLKQNIPEEFRKYEDEIIECYKNIRVNMFNFQYRGRKNLVYAILLHLNKKLGWGLHFRTIRGAFDGEKTYSFSSHLGNRLYKKIQKKNGFE